MKLVYENDTLTISGFPAEKLAAIANILQGANGVAKPTRGRPAKAPLAQTKVVAAPKTTSTATVATPEVTTEAPKRRGRPPKAATKPAVNEAPKKRGRPKKNPEAVTSTAAVVETAPVDVINAEFDNDDLDFDFDTNDTSDDIDEDMFR